MCIHGAGAGETLEFDRNRSIARCSHQTPQYRDFTNQKGENFRPVQTPNVARVLTSAKLCKYVDLGNKISSLVDQRVEQWRRKPKYRFQKRKGGRPQAARMLVSRCSLGGGRGGPSCKLTANRFFTSWFPFSCQNSFPQFRQCWPASA